jgi:membrane-bound ClpP family serine protease
MCLVVLEIFVPSGGILAVLTICAVLASIGLAFYQSPAVGVAILGAEVVGLQIVIVLALRWLTDTAVGQRELR